MTHSDQPAIRCERVVKDYATDWRGRRWRALDEVSFALPVGMLGVLVGPNGAGKSTLLRLCAGLARASSGRCEVLGQSPAAVAAAGRIGYVPDHAGLPSYLTVEAVLSALACLGGMGASETADAVRHALRETELENARTRRVGELSKGQRQRLGLAQAILGDPAVLLLDEPASGLDPRAVEQLARLLERWRGQGRSILLSSHFLPQVEELCDHVVLLERGRVVFAGPREAVIAAGGLHRVYLEKTAPC